VRPDRPQIVRQRPHTYFRPDGPSIKFYSSRHRNLQEYPIWNQKKNCSRPFTDGLVTPSHPVESHGPGRHRSSHGTADAKRFALAARGLSDPIRD
jgi:hypothetical protein